MWDVKPGMQVICIRSKPWKWGPRPWMIGPAPGTNHQLPQFMRQYTVREILIGSRGHPSLRLVELVNAPFPGRTEEPAFRVSNFRPLEKLETEITTEIKEPV